MNGTNTTESDLASLLNEARSEVENDGFRRGMQLSHDLTTLILAKESEILKATEKYAAVLPKGYPQSHFLRPTLSKDGCVNARHHLALSPLDRNGAIVWNELEKVAKEIAKLLETPEDEDAIEEIQTTLLLGTIINSRKANKSNILTINGTGKQMSPEKIYAIWKKGTESEEDNIQKSITLCKELGINLEQATLGEMKAMAWGFLSKIMKNANNLLDESITDDTITNIGISDTLQAMTIFEWLSLLFDKNQPQMLRLEAQLLLKLSLEFFNITNSRAFKNGTQMLREVKKQIQEVLPLMPEKRARYNRLKFTYKNDQTEIEVEEDKFESTPLRGISIDGFDQFKKQAIFIGFDHKKAESILTKLLTRDSNSNPEDIRDILRSTLVIPDVTTASLITNENGEKEYFKAIAMKLGEQMGLTYREYDDVKNNPLKVGEFTIEDNSEATNTIYRNFKLLGLLPDPKDANQIGTTVEIQINPIDIYELEKGINSPFKHNKYEAIRDVDVAKNMLAEDLYPQAITVLDEFYAKLKEERHAGTEAGILYAKNRKKRNMESDNLNYTGEISLEDSASTKLQKTS